MTLGVAKSRVAILLDTTPGSDQAGSGQWFETVFDEVLRCSEIVEFAMNLGVDLIVAGTRGRSPAKELYLGSVSSALTHRAPCSVLIVR